MKLLLLGATGSIGSQTLELLKENEYLSEIELVGVSIGKQIDKLYDILDTFPMVQDVYLLHSKELSKLRKKYPNTNFYTDKDSTINDLIDAAKPDLVFNALVGAVGLKPTLYSLSKKIDIAIANKESIVLGGQIIEKEYSQDDTSCLFVDSEHVSIIKLFTDTEELVDKIIITCSGGPFNGYTKEQLATVTKKDALNHPTRNMGSKITIDSATLMNKVFEIIEAEFIFKAPPEKIEVLIHPQSLVHGMLKFADGEYTMSLGDKDMKLPISYALANYQRIPNKSKGIDFASGISLEFKEPNEFQKSILKYGYDAIKLKGNYSGILLAANDYAVEKFLNDEISFLEIYELIDYAINNVKFVNQINELTIMMTQREVVDCLDEYLKNKKGDN